MKFGMIFTESAQFSWRVLLRHKEGILYIYKSARYFKRPCVSKLSIFLTSNSLSVRGLASTSKCLVHTKLRFAEREAVVPESSNFDPIACSKSRPQPLQQNQPTNKPAKREEIVKVNESDTKEVQRTSAGSAALEVLDLSFSWSIAEPTASKRAVFC